MTEETGYDNDGNWRKCFVGIADDDGIECLIPCESAFQNVMHLRAQANRSRNAVMFRLSIEENSARLLLGLLNEKLHRSDTTAPFKAKLALLALKCMNEAEQATVEVEHDQHHRWEQIPRGSADDIVGASIESTLRKHGPLAGLSDDDITAINTSSNSPNEGFNNPNREG